MLELFPFVGCGLGCVKSFHTHCLWEQTGPKGRPWGTAGNFRLYLTRCERDLLKFHHGHLVFLYGSAYLVSRHKQSRMRFLNQTQALKLLPASHSYTSIDWHYKHEHPCIFTRSVYPVCPSYRGWFKFFLLKTSEKLSAFHLNPLILCVFLVQNWEQKQPVPPVNLVWLFRETK